MKSILCQRKRVYKGIDIPLFLPAKSEKRACAVVYIYYSRMGNLPKNATMDPVLIFGFKTKKPSPLSLCKRRQVYAGKKRLRWHRNINAFFGLKTVFHQKSINLILLLTQIILLVGVLFAHNGTCLYVLILYIRSCLAVIYTERSCVSLEGGDGGAGPSRAVTHNQRA